MIKKTIKSLPIFDYTMDLKYKDKIIPAQVQNSVFKKFLSSSLNECIYLLSTKYNTAILKSACLEIEKKLDEENLYYITYDIIKNHNKEDKELEKQLIENGEPDLLFITGLFANTNINNIDKLRELISLFEGIPIIICISGIPGPEFFEEKVFLPYNKFIHFNDTPKKKIKEI